MADMMDTLKGILGDGAEDKIKTALGALGGSSYGGDSSGGDSSDENTPAAPARINSDSLEYIMKLKGIADELSHPNDARSTLLMSLRPYMRDSRQKGIDNAIRLLNLSKFSGLFR